MFSDLKNAQQEFRTGPVTGRALLDRALDYFEEVQRRLALTCIVIYERNGHPHEKLNDGLRKLCLPGPGDWNHFMDQVLKWYRRHEGPTFGGRLPADLDAALSHDLPPRAATAAAELLLELEGHRPPRDDLPFRALCDLIVRLRSWAARESSLTDDRRRVLGTLVFTALDAWLEDDSYLSPYKLERAKKSERVHLKAGAAKVLDYGFFIIAREDVFYYANGNNRLQRAEYWNPERERSFSDSADLLAEQIAWFAKLQGLGEDADVANVMASSISELEARPLSETPEDRVIAGDFKLLEEIGRGGMGTVYKALQISRGRLCAVKLLPRAIVADETIFHRFKREARTLESFNHPNIVEYMDFGETETHVYLAMEYIDGVNLDLIFRELRADINRRPAEDDLRRTLLDDGEIPAAFRPEDAQRPYYHKIARWLSEIADALQYIHEDGVLHRDIKHANIMIERSTGRPVLLDFGLARNQEMTLTMDGQFLGTMRFAAPEQLLGPRPGADHRGDVYSLGVVLYELFSLRPIFVGNNMEQLTAQISRVEPIAVRRVAPDIPLDLDTVVHRCLEKQPRFRYESAADLRDDLLRFERGETIKARPPSARRRLLKWVRNHPTRAMGIVAAALLLILSSAAMVRIVNESERARRAEIEALRNAKNYRTQRDRALALQREAVTQKRRADNQRDLAVQQKRLVIVQSRRARSAEIKNLAESSRTFFSEGKQFESLLPALKAGREAQRRGDELSADDYYLVAGALHQAVYERRELLRLEGHRGSVESIDFSPNGRLLVSAGREGQLNFWRASDGKIIGIARGHRGGVNSAAIHPRGNLAVSAGRDGTLRLWTMDGRAAGVLKGHAGPVYGVSFSPDGRYIASAGRDWTVRLWKVQRKGRDAYRVREIRTLNGHVDGVRSVHFSRDGKRLASGGDDKTIRIWRVRDGDSLALLRGHSDTVNAVRFNRRGDKLASAGADNTVRLWTFDDAKPLVLRGHTGSVNTVAFDKRGGLLASGSSDGGIRIWRHGRAYRTLLGHGGPVRHVSFGPRGNNITSAGADRTIRVWRIHGGRTVRTLARYPGKVYVARFSPDGRRIAYGGGPGRIVLRTAAAGRFIRELRGHKGDVNDLDFAPGGKLMASAGTDRTVRIWSTTHGRLLTVLRGHTAWVSSVAFSYDGSRLASAGGDSAIRIWNIPRDAHQSASTLRVLRGHTGEVLSVDYRGDGRGLASAGRDGVVRLWNASDGRLLRVLRGHQGWITRVRFSPDGTLIASASRDKTIRVWRFADGKLLKTLRGHGHWVADLDFSPDGRRLISAGRDRTLKFWRLSDGAVLNTFRGHPRRMESVTFSPDGRGLASAGGGLVKVWNLDLPRLVGLACNRVRWYLAQSPGVRVEDRRLCDGVPEQARAVAGAP